MVDQAILSPRRAAISQRSDFAQPTTGTDDVSDTRGHERVALVSFPDMDEEVVPVLRVDDAARAVSWYERLSFRKEWEHQFEPGFPWFVSVARGPIRLYLSDHKGDAVPNALIPCTSTTSTPSRRNSESASTKKASPGVSATSKIPMGTAYG